ncbi:hypothetical protein Dimus_024663 [Dionaea muscipula]
MIKLPGWPSSMDGRAPKKTSSMHGQVPCITMLQEGLRQAPTIADHGGCRAQGEGYEVELMVEKPGMNHTQASTSTVHAWPSMDDAELRPTVYESHARMPSTSQTQEGRAQARPDSSPAPDSSGSPAGSTRVLRVPAMST